jgi:hypothetical protein
MLEFTKTKHVLARNFIIVKNGNNTYKWYGKGSNIEELINSGNYIATIVHNSENKAMLDFEDRITGESVYRCEVNPATSTSKDWIVDDQV